MNGCLRNIRPMRGIHRSVLGTGDTAMNEIDSVQLAMTFHPILLLLKNEGNRPEG